MKSDFEMIQRDFENEKQVLIFPVADVHYGAIEHQKREWEAFVKRIADTPNAYVVLVGDLINNSTRSSVALPWDDLVRPREQKRDMVEYLRPIRDRILCAVSGNHEARSQKDADDDVTYDILSKLDLEDIYRPNAAFLKVRMCRDPSQKNAFRLCYVFAVTHGAGGGIYTGATVNRNERWGNVIDGADCIVVGHSHKGSITRPSKIVIDVINSKVSMQPYLVISCVSWQQYGGYAMRKMLLPTDTARPMVLSLSGIRDQKNIEVVW